VRPLLLVLKGFATVELSKISRISALSVSASRRVSMASLSSGSGTLISALASIAKSLTISRLPFSRAGNMGRGKR
jgi:hypothetical protein